MLYLQYRIWGRGRGVPRGGSRRDTQIIPNMAGAAPDDPSPRPLRCVKPQIIGRCDVSAGEIIGRLASAR